MPLIDAHSHVWRLDRGDYGWLEAGGPALAPINRDFEPADYPADMRRIVVQAAPSLAETDFLLGLAADEPRIVGVVGWVDLSRPSAIEHLTTRAADPILKGVRPMLQDIADTEWLEREARDDAVRALIDLGLRFDALVGTRHLPMLARFATRYPDLPLVIDHAAKPATGLQPEWREGMQALAAIPHVHCKLSGLLTEFTDTQLDDPLPALTEITGLLLDWFGPERLMWGSDWPVLTLAASYDRWQQLTVDVLSALPEAQRDAILGGTAANFYGVAV